ncbi:MAG: hypothetical protein IT374_04945, partial [Polyangiaceae bacterium]|nr:hypothetical protein [Polyangiaceae bacterium]
MKNLGRGGRSWVVALAGVAGCGQPKAQPDPSVVVPGGGAGTTAGGSSGGGTAAGAATAGGSAGSVAGGASAGTGGRAGFGGGGAAGSAGAGGDPAGKGGGGSAGSSGAGEGGAAGKTTTCPKGPGPAMVLIDVPGAAAYCIDSTEVTQAEYAAFLANQPDVAKQS